MRKNKGGMKGEYIKKRKDKTLVNMGLILKIFTGIVLINKKTVINNTELIFFYITVVWIISIKHKVQ